MSFCTTTFHQSILPSDLIFEMAKESASLYNDAARLDYEGKTKAEALKSLTIQEKTCMFLQSQSAQAAHQDFFRDKKSFFAALKEYKTHHNKFKNPPKPPKGTKFLRAVTFKKSAIRLQGNFLILSTRRPNQPIRVRWSLPIPIWAIIGYNSVTGWSLNCVVRKDVSQMTLNHSKVMAIDLGSKRIATTFDGTNTTTYSGKKTMSLTRLRNKINSATKDRLDHLVKDSKKFKRVKRANRRTINRIQNQIKEVLHKVSRTIVNDAVSKGIGVIAVGDCSDIHDETNLGSNNQSVQQNPDQKLRRYIQYKFESVGGTVESVPEHYTSQTCPKCGERHKTSTRTYRCPGCGFSYDRDGVGGINIYHHAVKVSSGIWLDVVGGLTPPKGWKHHPRLLCSMSDPSRVVYLAA